MQDITNEKIIDKRTFDGANGNKICMEIDGTWQVVKIPAIRENGIAANDSYTEYIGSHVAKLLGYSAHSTSLAKMDTPQGEKIVVMCEDVTDRYKSIELKITPFYNIMNSLYKDERAGRDTKLTSILKACEEQTLVDPNELKEFVAFTFALDTLLGNFDRHNGNWGLIIPENDIPVISPRYDFGSCLLSRANDEIIKDILDPASNALNQRIYQFPTAAVKDEKGNKIKYYEFWSTLKDNNYLREEDKGLFYTALKNLKESYDNNRDSIISFINESEIPSNLKDFYKTYIDARFEKIIDKSFDMNKEYFDFDDYYIDEDELEH